MIILVQSELDSYLSKGKYFIYWNIILYHLCIIFCVIKEHYTLLLKVCVVLIYSIENDSDITYFFNSLIGSEFDSELKSCWLKSTFFHSINSYFSFGGQNANVSPTPTSTCLQSQMFNSIKHVRSSTFPLSAHWIWTVGIWACVWLLNGAWIY